MRPTCRPRQFEPIAAFPHKLERRFPRAQISTRDVNRFGFRPQPQRIAKGFLSNPNRFARACLQTQLVMHTNQRCFRHAQRRFAQQHAQMRGDSATTRVQNPMPVQPQHVELRTQSRNAKNPVLYGTLGSSTAAATSSGFGFLRSNTTAAANNGASNSSFCPGRMNTCELMSNATKRRTCASDPVLMARAASSICSARNAEKSMSRLYSTVGANSMFARPPRQFPKQDQKRLQSRAPIPPGLNASQSSLEPYRKPCSSRLRRRKVRFADGVLNRLTVLRPGDTLLFALERATSTRGRLLQGGILDSVMRENISFVLTLFPPFPRASLERIRIEI
jgi:hypothetical protein